MASESSFDIVSKVDKQEVSNALHQAQKEISQRYDFRGVGAEIDYSGDKILIKQTPKSAPWQCSTFSSPSWSSAASP